MATRTLNVLLTGDASSLKSSFLSAVKGATGVQAGLAAVVVGAAAAGKALYDIGSEFDSAYDKIRVGTGATGKKLEQLEGTFRNVVSNAPVGFEEAAEAVTDLNKRLGVSGKVNERLSHQFLELSRITETDLGDNIRTVTRAFGDWEIKTGKQGKALDLLFRASQMSGAGVSELADNVVKFGAPLRQIGFSFNEAVAMFAEFEKAGVNTTTMLPGLKMAMKKFFEEDVDPKQGILKTFKGIEDGTIKTSEALKIFGTRAGGDMVEAIEQGRFHLGKFTHDIEHGKDTINKAGEQTKDASERFKELGNKLKVLVAPAASFVFNEVGKLANFLDHLSLKKIAHELGVTEKDLKDVGKVIGFVARTIATLFGKTISMAVSGAVQVLKGAAQIIKGVIGLVSDLIHGRWSKAWSDAKSIVSGALTAVIGEVKTLTAPLRAGISTIAGILKHTFGGAWDKVRSIFKDGINDVIGFLDVLIGAINSIPGIPDIGEISKIGEGGGEASTGAPGGRNGGGNLGKHRHGAQGRYMGGPITRPMAIVGEEAPQHHEWVIATNPKYRQNNIGYWMQAGHDLGIPGFSIGGDIVGAAKGAAHAVGNVVGKGAGFFIDHLPKPHLPKWISGVGTYVLHKVEDYIKHGFSTQKLGKFVGGPGLNGFTGAPANAKQLGNNAYVDSHTLAVTAYLDKKFGLTMSSGYRSPKHNAEIGGAPGSLHTHGSPSNPGATDSVGPMGAMQAYIAYAKQHVAGLQEAMVDNYSGSGWNAHLGFFKEGGLLKGRVTWFGGGGTAGGSSTSRPGVALNLHPGTDAGWQNATTEHWMELSRAGHPVFARVSIGGKTANLPITDLGPAGWTGNAIDVTEGGVRKLGFTTSTFPSGTTGKAVILGGGSGSGSSGGSGRSAPKQKYHPGKTSKGGGTYGPNPGKHPHKMHNPFPGAEEVIVGPKGNVTGFKVGGKYMPAVLKPGKVPKVLEGLDPSITHLFTGPGMSFGEKMKAAEVGLSIAAMTGTTEDDKALYQYQIGMDKRLRKRLQQKLAHINKHLTGRTNPAQRKKLLAERQHVSEELGTVQSNISTAREGIKSLSESEEDKNTEAIEALTQAIEDQKATEEDLLKSLEETRNIAESEMAIGFATARRFMADMISGQVGYNAYHQAQTPGTGRVGTM